MTEDTSKASAPSSLSLAAAVMLGLGSIIGGGVFATMGPALSGSGGAAPWAFVLGGVPAYATAASYVRMMRRYPGSGGTVAYFNTAFGRGYFASSLCLMLMLCYACIASLYAGVFGVYLAQLFYASSRFLEGLLSCAGVLAVMAMNLSRAPWLRTLASRLNVAKFLVMGVFMAAALLSPLWSWENFEPHTWKPAGSILSCAMTIFMSYQGFELMAAIGRPMRKASHIPWAFVLCFAAVTLYYVLMASCTLGCLAEGMMPRDSHYIISAVAERLMGTGGAILMCCGAIIASCSALNSDMFSVSPMTGEMADEGELPPYFATASAAGHSFGVILLSGLLLLFVSLLTVEELTAVASLGFLVLYAIVNAVSLKITERSCSACLLSGGACVLCLAAAALLLWQLYLSPRAGLLLTISAVMLLLPFIWQGLYFLLRRPS